MKTINFFLLTIVTLLCSALLLQSLQGQTTVNGGRSYIGLQDMHLGSWRAPEKTVSTLPTASASTGLIYMVTDGTSTSDCSTGGGSSFVNACRSNGTSWVFIGGSGGGGGTWGSISGTLSAQTDLQTALNGKQASLGFTPANVANNLSDLASASTARTNLGLGTAATQNTGVTGATLCVLNGAACTFTNSPVLPTPITSDSSTNAATTAYVQTAITNLGLGTASTKATAFFQTALGFTPANVANNLSDLASASTSRTNLGLGSIATHPTTDFVSATATFTQNQFLGSPNGSTGALAVRAIVAADIPTLNQSTTGNAATATALASTPTLCSTGQAPTGILANGNATGCAPTGSSTTVQYTLFRAINQNTIAGANFSLPASNAPTLTSVEGASSGDFSTASSATNYGTLSFAANTTAATANTVQGTINLPSTWSSSAGIPVQLTWRTSATTGNALWAIQGQCVAAGAVPGSFSSKTSFTASAAPGTTLQWAQTAVLTMTTSNVLSGCSAGNIFMFRLGRDHQNASDTITATEELIQAAFGVSQ